MDTGGEVPDKNNNERFKVVIDLADEKNGKSKVNDGMNDTDRNSNEKHSTEDDIVNPCSPCLGDDPPARSESVVYCLTCEEYLCLSCKKQHRRFKSTSNHSLLDVDTQAGNATTASPVTECCLEHVGAALEYYCEDDGILCCKLCVGISHSMCADVRYIPDECENLSGENSGVKDTENEAAEVVTKLNNIVKKKKIQVTRAKTQEDEALKRVLELTNVASSLIENLAREAKEEIQAVGTKLASELGDQIKTCEAAAQVLEGLISKLNIVMQSNNKQQIYIMLKNAEKQIDKYSEFVSKTEDNAVDVKLAFVTDGRFENMLHNLSPMGTIDVGPAPQAQVTAPISEPPSPCGSRASLTRRRVIPIGGQSVRIVEDRTTCNVTGCKFLPDGRIAIADYNNKCIKLFDSSFRLINYVQLHERPVDLVLIANAENEKVCEVLTSIAGERMIQYVRIARQAYIGRRVQTKASYSGLAYSRKKVLYASCCRDQGTGEVHVINLEGDILQIIGTHHSVNPALIRPGSLYIDDDRRLLYVMDLGQNCVVCFDTNPKDPGNIQPLYKYFDRNLELRAGMITADNDDNLYICSGNQSVHQISTSCQKIYEILTASDGIGLPHCLAFSHRDSLLLLSEHRENGVKLFKLN